METLQQALIKEPDNARYVFYLAKSWFAADELEKALATYDRRAAMGGWDEEVFISHLFGARIAEKLQRPQAELMDRYLRAHESLPSRAEPLGDLARVCRQNGRRWPLAYMFASRAARIPCPSNVLLVDFPWYEWRALDELAVSAYWVGEYEESKNCCERLLGGGKLPDEHRERLTRLLEAAQLKLGSKQLVGV